MFYSFRISRSVGFFSTLLFLISTVPASGVMQNILSSPERDSCPKNVNQKHDVDVVDRLINNPAIPFRSVKARIHYPKDRRAVSPVYFHGAGASNEPFHYDFLARRLAQEGIVTVIFQTLEVQAAVFSMIFCAANLVTLFAIPDCMQDTMMRAMISDTEALMNEIPQIESAIPGRIARDASSPWGYRVGIGGHSAGAMNALTTLDYEWDLEPLFGKIRKSIDARAYVPMDFHVESIFNTSNYGFDDRKPVLMMSSGLSTGYVNLTANFPPPIFYNLPIERLVPITHFMFYKQTRKASVRNNDEYLFVLPQIDHGDFTSKSITPEDYTIANTTAAFLTEYLECDAPTAPTAIQQSREYIYSVAGNLGHVFPNHALVEQCAMTMPEPLSKDDIKNPPSGSALERWLIECGETIYNH